MICYGVIRHDKGIRKGYTMKNLMCLLSCLLFFCVSFSVNAQIVSIETDFSTEDEPVFWLSNSSRLIHNSNCKYFRHSKGRFVNYSSSCTNCHLCGGTTLLRIKNGHRVNSTTIIHSGHITPFMCPSKRVIRHHHGAPKRQINIRRR